MSKSEIRINGDLTLKLLQEGKCFNCLKSGHKASECKEKRNYYNINWNINAKKMSCTYCKMTGHEQEHCFQYKRIKASGVLTENKTEEGNIEVSTGQSGHDMSNDIQECIIDNRLMLKNGKSMEVITNSCMKTELITKNKMHVTKGKIGNRVVTVLRDTGCSGVIVKRQFVDDEQLTGKQGLMVLVDNTARKAPFVKIYIDTLYLTGKVDDLCLEDVIYDLTIGNVADARAPDDPNEN